jgi:hypothetical protein
MTDDPTKIWADVETRTFLDASKKIGVGYVAYIREDIFVDALTQYAEDTERMAARIARLEARLVAADALFLQTQRSQRGWQFALGVLSIPVPAAKAFLVDMEAAMKAYTDAKPDGGRIMARWPDGP